MRKRKRLSGILLIIAALIIMQLPVSEADAASSSASDFKIESGVLVKYRGTETNVSIPDTVEVIGEGAFEDNTRVELVVVPNSVKRIEAYAFWGCDNLDTVVLGKGLTEVENFAFAGCSGLVQMTIPSNIRSIGASAFADCVNLRDISIASETTDIDASAFDGCYRLTIHCEPGSVADKYAQEFYERQKEMPEYQDVPEYPEGDNNGENSVTPVPDNTVPSEPSTTPVPGNVLGSTQIVGNHAVFFIDNKLPTVMSSMEGLPSSADTLEPVGDLMQAAGSTSKYTIVDNRIIADQAYYRNKELGEAAIPLGIEELGQFSFARSSITGVTVPVGVKKISYGAFYHCDGLERVSLPTSITLVEPKAFSYTPWLENFLGGMPVEGNESSDGNYLISGGVLVAYRGTDSQAVIPHGVRVIAADAFRDHGELESVMVPDSVTVIGEGAFEGCGNLTAVSLGSKVYQVKDRAFEGCGLQQITLPESVQEVGIWAFGNAEVSFAGEAFEIPNSYETTATRLSNEDYRNPSGEPGEAGVTVVGMDGAYAELEGAARSYTLAVTHIDDTSALEQACVRSFKASLPENMAAYDLTLLDSGAVPITKLGRQILTVILPLPEHLSGQRLQVLTLDRNGQPELLAAERVMMEGVESVRFRTNHLSPFGIYGLGMDDSQEGLQEISVELTSQSEGPAVKGGGVGTVSKMIASGLALALGILLIVMGTIQRSKRL